MKYVVAVSGGVDSVVLLDTLAKESSELIVAHFDHGIRDDSAADARFVAGLAKKYALPFETSREELGSSASEELARRRRHAFLHALAKKHDAVVVTAHHADDIVETVAINLVRGTGWRGLAVLDSKSIVRPLLNKTKAELYEYALTHRLEWVEDSTNMTAEYLRNRVRRKISRLLTTEEKQAVLKLREEQVARKRQIDAELVLYARADEQSRYLFTYMDENVACELLRAAVVAKTHASPMRPQLVRALLAIKTAKPGTIYELGGGVSLRFLTRTFVVQTP